jgi:hypothetical protein
MLREQSVAEHSYRVAIIAGSIAKELGFASTTIHQLMVDALLHDANEAFSGDIPRTYKMSGNMGLYIRKPASSAMDAILRVADLYEATEWVRSWGRGPRIPGIIKGLEEDLTKAVDEAQYLMPEFLPAYQTVNKLVTEEE